MQIRWLAVSAAMLFICGAASAQPKVAAGPTIEVRLRSVNDLVSKFEYLAGLSGQDDAVKQLRELIKVLTTEGKGIEGIDPAKPFGAYATLGKEIETSPFIVMIPIADQDQLLNALKARLDIATVKSKDGTYKAELPQIIDEVHLRFTGGYLYVSQKAEDLDPKKLISPKDFFTQDDGAVASLLVHIDRIPADVKTFALGQLELGINEERKKDADTETAAEKQLKNLILDTFLFSSKSLADDAKELSVKVFIDEKGGEVTAELTLTTTTGSPTARHFASLGKRSSLPAGIVAHARNPIAHGNVKISITDGMRKEYEAAVDALREQLIKDAHPETEAVVKQVAAALSPTFKAGELDAAAALVGPDAKGRFQFLAAVAVNEGKGIEKFVREMMKQFGQTIEVAVAVKLDVATIGDFTLHRFDIKQIDNQFEKVFGTKSVWVAISDKHIVMSIEPEGDTIRGALKAKAMPAPIVSVELGVAKLLPIIRPELKPDELKALIQDAFGDGPITNEDTVKLVVEGGEKLTVRFKMKGKAIRLMAGLALFNQN